jgi:hypothetical protein
MRLNSSTWPNSSTGPTPQWGLTPHKAQLLNRAKLLIGPYSSWDPTLHGTQLFMGAQLLNRWWGPRARSTRCQWGHGDQKANIVIQVNSNTFKYIQVYSSTCENIQVCQVHPSTLKLCYNDPYNNKILAIKSLILSLFIVNLIIKSPCNSKTPAIKNNISGPLRFVKLRFQCTSKYMRVHLSTSVHLSSSKYIKYIQVHQVYPSTSDYIQIHTSTSKYIQEFPSTLKYIWVHPRTFVISVMFSLGNRFGPPSSGAVSALDHPGPVWAISAGLFWKEFEKTKKMIRIWAF